MQQVDHNPVATGQLLQLLTENSFDLLALIDSAGKYLYVSESVYQTLHYKANEMVGTVCFAYMHPDDQPRILQQFESLFQGERKLQVSPYRFRSANGNWHWVEAIVTNQLENPTIQAIVVSGRDITRQVETETKLKEMQMLEALMEGEEKERIRIARDLHDGVAGMIAAAKMQFEALAEKQRDISQRREYEQGMGLLASAASLIRNTSHNLMPEMLLENGLSEALRRYCSSISHDNFHIDYYSFGQAVRFPANFELSLYRISQELIGNIIRHAAAPGAFVQLSYHDAVLSLTIEDRGRGFSYNSSLPGTGLRSIIRRIEAMAGRITINTEEGKGTSITLEFEK